MRLWLRCPVASNGRRQVARFVALMLLLFCAGVSLVQTTGCSRGTPPTLRAGYAEFHPYVGADEQGKPAGLAVEVLNLAARKSGVRLQWVRTDDAEGALRRGQIDLYPIFTVTPEREQALHMSMPWWEYSQILVSRREK